MPSYRSITSGPLMQPNRMPQVTRINTGYLYSARLLPASFNVGPYDFFVTPQGVAGQNFTNALTATETNLLNSQRIPDQNMYRITEVGFHVSNRGEGGTATATPLADLRAIMHFSALTFVKPEYTYTFGPVFLWPSGSGIFGTVGATGSGAGATAVESWANGWPSPAARTKLDVPLVLMPGDTFKFTLNCRVSQNLGETTKVWLFLKGETQAVIAQ